MRLKRVGRRNNPLFRVVVTEGSRGPKSEKAIEILGSYNPHQNVKTIDAERASYWISKGVQPSGTVHNILVDLGVVKTKKVNVLPQKSPVKKEVAEEKAAPQASKDAGEEAPAEVSAEAKAEEAPAEEAPAPAETEGESHPPAGGAEVPEEEKPDETVPEEKPEASPSE